MNDQPLKYCANCFAPYNYERSTKTFCSDLCRVTYFNKKADTTRREEYLNNLYKGSDEIAVEMIVEDATGTDITADSDTPLASEQEICVPTIITVDEEANNLNDRLIRKSPYRGRKLRHKEPYFMATLLNTISDFCEYTNKMKS
ncbi:MAG: hypothetical protein WC780_15540 [Lentimicrobiaceae bacterium]|jgi:hypothetical protein